MQTQLITVLVGSLLVWSPAAATQDARDAFPANVSLSNAVAGHQFASLTAAIDQGDSVAVLRAGGTLSQAATAVGKSMSKINPNFELVMARFADLSDGASIRLDQTGSTGALLRINPDGSVIKVGLDGRTLLVTGRTSGPDVDRILDGP